ncbi:MAG: sterol desaturase family protein [Deltaproteobacteria bacterium]|nr:sterol desaturase family protein [Deltaproteobacteria bacterium]
MMGIGFFLLGAMGWSASEYAIHRFVGHGPKRKPAGSLLAMLTPKGIAAEFNREHLAHHADPSYFAPTERKVLAAAAVLPVVVAAMSPLVGVRRAVAFGAGFTLAYGTYEFLHRRIHTHPPRNAYGRWLRRHHLLHHYKTPRKNHGVTSALWDHVFSTYTPKEKVRVTDRMAAPWLADATGHLRQEHADDYELVTTSARARGDAAAPAAP